ncbi:hypothetical protein GS507_28840 [Rhodococcus hoagii]|nr:hypothetical protein [Prescottella equi]
MSVWDTPERQQLRKTVRGFVEQEILPHLGDWERDGEIPRELHRGAAALGLLGAGFPEEVGGDGGDLVDAVVICEEMGGILSSTSTDQRFGSGVGSTVTSGRCRRGRRR